MSDSQLLAQISSLPAEMKKEVSGFVEFLKQKSRKKSNLKERVFGYAKGFFKSDNYRMSDDFDEPLEDFEDYR